MAYIPKNYARLDVGYREKALAFSWVFADAAHGSLSTPICAS